MGSRQISVSPYYELSAHTMITAKAIPQQQKKKTNVKYAKLPYESSTPISYYGRPYLEILVQIREKMLSARAEGPLKLKPTNIYFQALLREGISGA